MNLDKKTALFTDWLESPIGTVEVTASETGLRSVYFVEQTQPKMPNRITNQTVEQLTQYFENGRRDFDLTLEPIGTDFQRSVWAQLQNIRYGQIQSYKLIAEKISNPKAVRAVGAANGQNPISIIIPCHRVIASNGQLSGYAGGIERKVWLLQHEGAII